MTKPLIYEALWIHFAWGIFRVVFCNVSTDSMFLLIGDILSDQFQKLKNEFISLRTDPCEREIVKSLIKKHQKLIIWCQKFNELYFWILITQFIFITTGIALLGFQIIMVSN